MAKTFKSVEAVLPGLLEEKKMLEILDIVEKDVLPELLGLTPSDLYENAALWQSMYIDYEKPFVERLWYQLGQVRINLHKIYPCEKGEAFFHPHPWPSAMHIFSGVYETVLGYGTWQDLEPATVFKGMLTGGEFSKYEMTHPCAWHYVRPIGGPVFTLMVTGEPWKTGKVVTSRLKSKSKKMRALTQVEKHMNLSFFWDYYLGDSWRAAKQ